MQGMNAEPGADLGALAWYLGMWVTMMAAMMLPSVAPMVLLYAHVSRERHRQGGASFIPTWVFVAGYLGAWTAFGLRLRRLPARHGRRPRVPRMDEAGPYDLRLVLGDGGHDPNHGGVILPDALRWLWRRESKVNHGRDAESRRRSVTFLIARASGSYSSSSSSLSSTCTIARATSFAHVPALQISSSSRRAS